MKVQVLEKTQPTNTRWRQVAKWGGAFLGFPLGGLAALATVGSVDNTWEGLIGGAAAGVVLGTAQWLALRSTNLVSIRWIGATGLGLGAGVALAVGIIGAGTNVPEILARAPLTGLVLGAAQAFELRRQTKLAAWWVPVTTLAYSVGWLITQAVIKENVSNGFATFGSSGAIVFQALTGLALYWLFSRKAYEGSVRT